jgi:oligoendopeptidase F
MKKSPKRADIPVVYTWKIDDIYPSVEVWETDLAKLRDSLQVIKQFDGHLDNVESLHKCFVMLDDIQCRAERLYSYAHLSHHTDMTDSGAQGLVNRIDKMIVDVREMLSFVDPEILSCSQEKLAGFITAKELAFYKFSLEKKLRLKSHTLPKEQEEIVARTGILSQLPETVFSMLNDADMKFPPILDENNNEIELTHARYGKCLESHDRRVRRDAFHAHFSTYRKQQHTITSLFNGNIQKDLFYARTLHYPSALSMALFDDNIPYEVYDNLLTTVHQHLPVFHRYLRLRKKILGVEDLHLYDLSVPLVNELNVRYTYEEAQAVVRNALLPLGNEYNQIVEKAFNNRWIDVFENDGKHSGGYNWGVFRIHPYILLNYEGTLNDLFTIAHEIGHAVHSYLSNRFQEYHYASYSIFIAEIASTHNEALLLHHLLNTTTDLRRRMYLLSHFTDNFRATVIVQTLFAEFEKIVHDLAENGFPLTLEKLNEVYFTLHQKYYGNEVTLDNDVEIGWMRIPHFYQSFYVYKYATGFSAAQFLMNKIITGDRSAVERYHELLKSGGKDYPLALLRKAGVDMSVPEPVRDAFINYENVIVELGKLL